MAPEASTDRRSPRGLCVITDESVGGAGPEFWSSVEGIQVFDQTDALFGPGEQPPGNTEGRPTGIIVDGDDRLVSRVLTNLRRRDGRGAQIPMEVVKTGTFRSISRQASAGTAETIRSRLRRGTSDWLSRERRTLPMLRITSSMEPGPVWGANFAAGAWYKLAEVIQRGGGRFGGSLRSAARSALDLLGGADAAQWRVEGAKVTIDRKPWSETVGHLLASSLESSWLGTSIASRGAPGWFGDSKVGTLPKMLARGRLPGLGNDEASAFDRIHLNWRAGFVVDGRLFEAGVPHAAEVAPAPGIDLVRR